MLFMNCSWLLFGCTIHIYQRMTGVFPTEPSSVGERREKKTSRTKEKMASRKNFTFDRKKFLLEIVTFCL
jgi:hypothetical protein